MRRGPLALLLILVALPALFLAPFDLGSVRIAGVSLAWWYGGAAGPLLGFLLTLACLPTR